jgi:membrane protein DedA with SNARE-associated domain/membrane-associated phospholipid phosphatase
MLNFPDLNIQTMVQFFQAHPNSISISVYLICFAEAMAVIGAFIPGAIAMPAIGFLIGLSLIPAGPTFMWAILGAATGDILSYLIGVYFQDRIHTLWPFTRWPNLLERSEKFFHKHGGKSVFIGRFIGPMRAMMPMIAGMFKMSIVRFLFVALTSAILWALVYIIPGMILGALSLELPAKMIAKYALWIFAGFLALWLIIWLVQRFFRQIWRIIDFYVARLWRYIQNSQKLSWFARFLSNPENSDNHSQLMLLVVVLFMIPLSWWSALQVLGKGIFTTLNYPFYYLLSSFRTVDLDYVFLQITFLGDTKFILIVAAIAGSWLIWKRYWYAALHWLAIVGGSGVIIFCTKFLIKSARPGGILYAINEPSFPSAHTIFSLALYGFLAVIIAEELKGPKKNWPYFVAGTITTLVAISRLYLGAHWLIDVYGGVFVGLAILIITSISYRRRYLKGLNAKAFSIFLGSILVFVWMGYGLFSFNKKLIKYTLFWPKNVIALDSLIKGKPINVPLYRLNRLGKPTEALNVLYLGSLSSITAALERQGWEPRPVCLTLKDLAKIFSDTPSLSHLTILPQLYHNERPVLSFTKRTKQNGETLLFSLWPSNIELKGADSEVWIGTVEHYRTMTRRFSLKSTKTIPVFIGATKSLAADLKKKDFALSYRQYPFVDQPLEMKNLFWDGHLLILKSVRLTKPYN